MDSKVKFRAPARLALHPHSSAHESNKTGRDGQTQSGTAELARGGSIGLAEGFKNRALLLKRNANPGISNAHRKFRFACCMHLGPGNNCNAACMSEFDGIANQVQ